ncbi:MAG: hypothetical protein FVQ85_19255 [Planctomycetes bacterium]|nr:hypothetical protein [Planctomycetota bacterium]
MRKRNGFTLIDLLVVMGVLVLLTAMLLPVLGRARSQAKVSECQSNLRQWGLILQMYADDNKGRLPNGHIVGNACWWSFSWIDDYPASGAQDILCCPVANDPMDQTTAFNPWMSSLPPHHVGSYGINVWHIAWDNCAPSIVPSLLGHPINQWENIYHEGANNIPVLLDCILPVAGPVHHIKPPPYENVPISGSDGVLDPFCINRHDGGINSLFLDWSVRKVGLKELWTLKWHKEFNTANKWTSAGGVQPSDWPDWMRQFKDY